MKRILLSLISTSFAGVYILAFAISIGVATFVENDYGTDAAQKLIYQAWWFELLLFMFALTLLNNMIKFRMFRMEKLPVLMFHLSMIIILIGAGVTRYYGFEGMMHIRENAESNVLMSSKSYITVEVEKDGIKQGHISTALFAGIGKNKWSYQSSIEGTEYQVELIKFHPSAEKTLVEAEEGKGSPILSIVTGGANGRVKHFLEKASAITLDGFKYAFHSEEASKATADILLVQQGDSIMIRSVVPYTVTTMATQTTDSLMKDSLYELYYNRLYNFDNHLVVFTGFQPDAEVIAISKSVKVRNDAIHAIDLLVSSGNETRNVTLWGSGGMVPAPQEFEINNIEVSLSYGSRNMSLPFSIYLKDFQLERYPGSNSASSYASEIELRDPDNNYTRDFRIYMNNILDYKGYRFFQSSFDKDEKGTVLSVNHDFWGTWISYIGYIFLTIGLVLTLFYKNTRFNRLSKNISKLHAKKQMILLLLLSSWTMGSEMNAQEVDWTDSLPVISAVHANQFGRLLVQDKQGRIEPMNTLTSEVLRKVAGKSGIFGQNSDQVVLGMLTFPRAWQHVPMIKIGHEKIRTILGVSGKRAAMIDFYDDNDTYILRPYIEEAVNKRAMDRGEFEKQLLKADERFNICYMVYTASLLRIFPKEDDENNTWYDPMSAAKIDFGDANVLAKSFMPFYTGTLEKAVESKMYEDADFALNGLAKYQKKVGAQVIPPASKIQLEIWYNKSGLFGYLALWYVLVGLLFLIYLMYQLFFLKPIPWLKYSFTGLIFIGILAHTLGLIARWYISGHAPWSNGYESMIYIGWAAVVAGLIFVKKSPITLAVTAILSAVILGVAGLSWLDPEITNLVPVLKSYWMTIHVSIIVASYGPFALGAMMAFLNLILFIFRTNKNHERITLTIKELSNIIEMTLIIGVVMLSIGTYLGGVWANESWGRYWGWDAKETWALVSILVYSFILHMRLIPGMKDMYSFNLAAVIGFFSILMTYFGVNYYLSGLHSYAAGEAVPIPTFVYYMLGIIFIVATAAFFKADNKERYG